MLVVVLLVQQIEGHVLQPFLMGHAVSLHPVAVLLSVAAGSFVAGIVGALFAVPIAATLNTVLLYLHGHDKFPQLGTDDHVPVRGRGHPVLDRAIAQVAEATSERVATEAETAERADADEPPADGRHGGGGRRRAGWPGRRVRRRARDDRPRRHPRGGGAARGRRRPHAGAAQPGPVAGRAAPRCGSSARTCSAPGSFKLRGAYVRMARLSPEEQARGVVAASAGNHAQGVALAARMLGLDAVVFMPADAALPKIAATRDYGARVELVGASVDEALVHAREYAERTGAVLIHPFDHEDVVAGQGTIALEIVEQVPDVATVVVPIGGGGLAAGVVAALAELRPDVRVIGVQAARAASYPGVARGRPPDPGARAADHGRRHRGRAARRRAVRDPGRRTTSRCVTVSEEDLSRALLLVAERAKMLVEPSGAAAAAAVMAGVGPLEGPVVAILSGGNIDPLVLMRVVRHGLASAGRFLQLQVRIDDTPGALADLLRALADTGGNVMHVSHARTVGDLQLDEVAIEVQVETKGPDHCEYVRGTAAGGGLPARDA